MRRSGDISFSLGSTLGQLIRRFLTRESRELRKGFHSRLFVCVAGLRLPIKAADGHETPTHGQKELKTTSNADHKQKETKTTKRNIDGRKKYTFVCFVIFCLIAPNHVNSTDVYLPEVVCRHA